jgi:hypothetical protein
MFAAATSSCCVVTPSWMYVQTCCAGTLTPQPLACRAMRAVTLSGHILTVPVTFNDLHDCCYNDRSHPPGAPVGGRLEQATQTDCASKRRQPDPFLDRFARKCGTKSPLHRLSKFRRRRSDRSHTVSADSVSANTRGRDTVTWIRRRGNGHSRVFLTGQIFEYVRFTTRWQPVTMLFLQHTRVTTYTTLLAPWGPTTPRVFGPPVIRPVLGGGCISDHNLPRGMWY